MTRTTHELDDLTLTLPISREARIMAQKFANEQPNPIKAEQVLLNTLSVWVVNDYLQMMEVSTQLKVSDSWNPVVRLCADVADLELPGIGRLECRPVRMHSATCYIPPETWSQRVGYIIVEVDESLQQAKLLGFVKNVATEELPLNRVQPLEVFLEHLEELRHPVSCTLVNLSQWFAGMFETGWQTIESLLNQPELAPAYAFRDGTSDENAQNESEALLRRAKLIDLGIKIANYPVMLIVELRPEAEQQTSIRLQLHPTGNQSYLPQQVQMTVLDETGAVFLETEARSADNYIQLQFSGEPKEEFGVRVALNDASVTEHFVI